MKESGYEAFDLYRYSWHKMMRRELLAWNWSIVIGKWIVEVAIATCGVLVISNSPTAPL